MNEHAIAKAAAKHCVKTGNQRYIVPDSNRYESDGTIEPSNRGRYCEWNTRRDSDEREEISDVDEDGAIKLKYPTAMILF